MTDKEIIGLARQVDLVEYFRSSGYTVEKKGAEYYVKEISNGRFAISLPNNDWYDHYHGHGARGAIDCLEYVFEMDFKEAVYALTGQQLHGERQSTPTKRTVSSPFTPARQSTPTPKTEVVMPEPSKGMAPLYAYLHKTRGIPYDVIQQFIDAKLLYQTNRKMGSRYKSNAVFVHFNEEGKAVGGDLQGLDPVYRFKGMVTGSGDSTFQFQPADGEVKRAFIFEAPIDLMSFYSMFRDSIPMEGTLFVSLSGLKPSVPMKLKESGVEIISCVDNDEAGRDFEVTNGFLRCVLAKEYLDKNNLKDWNDLLRNPNGNPPEEIMQQKQDFINTMMRSRS